MREAAVRAYGWLTADRSRLGAFSLIVVAGLLLWARLIVISDLPRTAIAEPDAAAVEAAPASAPSNGMTTAPTSDSPPVAQPEPAGSKAGTIAAFTDKSAEQVTEDRN